jgi:copper resistance protein C
MRTFLAIISVLATLIGAPAAQAHAFLDHADPPANGAVQTAPPQLTLWFTQKLEPAFSNVQVTGPNGARIDQGQAQISGNVMRIGIKAAGPGTYQVHWHALSVDTHTTEGGFTFRVGNP